MRTSPRKKALLIRALSASTLVCGLVAAITLTTAATSSGESAESATLTGATQTDRGLTAAEAVSAMEGSAEAGELEGELRDALGSDFGGAVYDTDSGELTVHVTDTDAVPTVRAAGADAEVVTYGERELDAMIAELDESAAQADENVTGWYSDIAGDSVVIEVLAGDTAAAEELVADAGIESDAVRVEETSERPMVFPDIIGGQQYFFGNFTCSVGFSVEGGFVSAGHCGSEGTATRSPDGVVAGSIFPGRDMGWVETTSEWTPTPLVTDHQGGTVTVTGSTEAPVGASVCRSGNTTGWRCGVIEAKNQTVNYQEGQVSGLVRSSACAEPGDSGGPFLAGGEAQGVTSGGSGNCTSGGTTYYQPVNPILQEWNLTLVTG